MIRKHVKNICLGLLIAGAAAASPLTYNFTQGGWPTGSMNGSFTGAPEANGVINLADLTSFNATFFDLPAASFPFSLSNLDGFFFNTADRTAWNSRADRCVRISFFVLARRKRQRCVASRRPLHRLPEA